MDIFYECLKSRPPRKIYWVAFIPCWQMGPQESLTIQTFSYLIILAFFALPHFLSLWNTNFVVAIRHLIAYRTKWVREKEKDTIEWIGDVPIKNSLLYYTWELRSFAKGIFRFLRPSALFCLRCCWLFIVVWTQQKFFVKPLFSLSSLRVVHRTLSYESEEKTHLSARNWPRGKKEEQIGTLFVLTSSFLSEQPNFPIRKGAEEALSLFVSLFFFGLVPFKDFILTSRYQNNYRLNL